ncbi:MAG: hypothetical protein ACRDRF_05160, partial [Pseudonocardiaceae bacterium]
WAGRRGAAALAGVRNSEPVGVEDQGGDIGGRGALDGDPDGARRDGHPSEVGRVDGQPVAGGVRVRTLAAAGAAVGVSPEGPVRERKRAATERTGVGAGKSASAGMAYERSRASHWSASAVVAWIALWASRIRIAGAGRHIGRRCADAGQRGPQGFGHRHS